MKEITFIVRTEEEGGFSASWDAPGGGGISTQGDDLAELQAMIRDAVEGYFDVSDADKPEQIRIHFIEDPRLVCA